MGQTSNNSQIAVYFVFNIYEKIVIFNITQIQK